MNIGNSDGRQVEDFTVSIKGDAERTYLEADGQKYPDFRVPFTRDEIEAALGDYSPNRVSTDPLAYFGSTLFSALFREELGRNLWIRLAEVERNNRSLRLRILSNLERTQHLPWELLFDPSRGDFISLSGRVALVRTRPDPFSKTATLEPLPTLRILAAAADVTGNMRTGEDLAILKRFAIANPGRIDLTVLDQATPAALEKRLGSGKFDVFHFAGTGEVLPYVSKRGGVRQSLRLMGAPEASSLGNSFPLRVETAGDPLMDRQDLGKLLEKAGVRLAVLNACYTDWVARSVAKYIPSTIGFRESVRVESCLTLCESLYRSLLAGSALDLSVTAARQALDRANPGAGDWYKIIFYLQHPDGEFLLSREQETTRAAAVPTPGENKEVAKLSRLLEVYERNLIALERGASSAPAVNTFREQSAELQRKRDDIRQQLAEARTRTKLV